MGAIIFGYIGDKISRKKALLYSIILMALSSTAISLLPSYEQMGVWASILLIILRILGGISVGGEYTSSAIYVMETNHKNQNSKLALVVVGAVSGFLLGSLVSLSINHFLTDEQVYSWGWRAAFFSGIIISLVGIWLREHMPEITLKENKEIPIKTLFYKHKSLVLQNIGLELLNSILYYILFVYTISWLTEQMNISKEIALDINLISLIVLIIAILIGGYLGDKFNAKRILNISFSAISVLVYPLFWLISHQDPILILIGEVTLALLMGVGFPCALRLQISNIPKSIRASGVAISYNLTAGIFGGTAPLIASWISLETHNSLFFTFYISIAGIISLIALNTMKVSAKE